jgi:outer membrane protein OmpA-like peptidoglycan-associated protein/uncharacterized surface protein with fasciclin (FAS1) repeats
MSSPSRPVSRYQRRILAWGGGVACLLYVIGAPIYLGHVESDLTERVSDELADAGFDAVTVSFSGQTGSIGCVEPLRDPRAALDVAYEVRGVRVMDDLPDSCRVLTAAGDEDADDAAAGGTDPDADVTTSAAVDTDLGTSSSTTTTSTLVADFATVLDVLGGNPQFSLLRQLVQDADLAATLAGPDPITMFAPTNAAFDALPADTVAQLRSSPELLDHVLGHHLVEGQLLVADLATGPLATAAGDELVVDADGDAPTIGGASIVEPDVRARNGVVHAVDALLVPAGVDLSAPERLASMAATFTDGGYLLEGVVRSEVERTILVGAATTAVGPTAVTDQLTVDPDLGLDESTAQGLATLIASVADSLVSGAAGFDGEMLVVTGTYADDAGRAAVEQAAAAVGAESTLTPRPAATEGDAAGLEAELNSFVSANPILFEPSSSILDESALPILDEVARRAQALSGVTITVEGHTDSDGGAQENLVLSQLRAVAVQQALVERGLAPDAVAAEGFGSARPVLVDGVEDKAASRRVEFRVVDS